MSWQSRLLNLILRLRRNVVRDIQQVYALRQGMVGMDARFGTMANTGTFEPIDLGDFSMEIYYPEGELAQDNSARKLLFFCHGGAYCLSSPKIYAKLLKELCDELGCVGALPDYRLAPEHPHPSGIDDCVAAYQHLIDQGYRPENMVMMGDSAGGGLTLSVLQTVLPTSGSRPAAALLISPAGDWSLSGKSFFENEGRDPMFRIASFLFFRSIYMNGHTAEDPKVSPIYGSFANFPPLLVLASNTELLSDTAVDIVRRAQEAGGDATLDMAEGLCHDYPLMGFLPEAKAARQRMVDFCRRAFDTESADTSATAEQALA